MKNIFVFFVFLLVFPFKILATPIDDGISFFNSEHYKQAKVIFKSLADQGNSRAIFWLGVTQFKLGKKFEAGDTLRKAAMKGNPWAMHLMVPSYNGNCDYLGWDCDEGWMDKAIIEWDNLAKNGDGKAIYALMRYKKKPWWHRISFFSDEKKENFKLIKKAVYSGGYEAASYNNHYLMNIKDQVELLKYEVSKGYAPAMVYLYYIDETKKLKIENSINLLKRALKLGYSGGASVLYSHFEKRIPNISNISDINQKDRKIFKKAYYYSLIAKAFGVRNTDMTTKILVNSSDGGKELVDVLSLEEKQELSIEAKNFIKNIIHNDFYDDSTVGEIIAL